jgi:membrane protein YdbS with pleckstrin-like domain
MPEERTVMEGRPCMAAALAVAALAFVLFGALAAVLFLVPDPLKTGHIVLGGIIAALAAIAFPWQVLDARSRRHRLTERSLVYTFGLLSRTEMEIPYTSIQAVIVRQGPLQRLFGCGDVRVGAHGLTPGGIVVLSKADLNTVCIKSIPDHREVGDHLRARLGGSPPPA